jgi:propionate CoA-transferase
MKLITADDVGPLIPDGASVLLGGLAMMGMAETVLHGLERHFLATGHPRQLTTWACGAIGNGRDGGMAHLAHPGMVRRMVAGHFGQTGAAMMARVQSGEVEAYNFPQGSLASLVRHVASRSPGLLTKIGLGTFVDPRHQGGKLNRACSEDLIKLVPFEGDEYLYYRSPRIDVALIRGTYADESGNISLDKEGVLLDQLSAAQAARACGGVVIAQVEAVVKAGSLHPKSVKVPGLLVDYVVIAPPEHHLQTITTAFNPALSGDIRVPLNALQPLPLDERKVIARRAALALRPGDVTNLGIGIPAGIPAVAAEEGVSELLRLSVECGVNGGVPAFGGDFGLAYNAESIIEQSAQFDFYDGGGLDCSFLGLAQVDAQGNVNVSQFNGRPVGCGGFINITSTTRRLIFCGTFTAGGLELQVNDGRLTIVQEGRSNKFVEQVEQLTFSGRDAAMRQQEVLFVTERAVFTLTPSGLQLIEVAPGISVERDVLAHMAFRPLMGEIKTMDPGLFRAHWGGLAAALPQRHPA